MRARLVTALALGVLLIGALLYFPPLVAGSILGLIVLIGAWEWSAFLGAQRPAARLAYVLVIAALGLLGRVYAFDAAHFLLLMGVSLVWWLIALLWVVFAPQRVAVWAAALAGALALVPTWLALVRIDALWPRGHQWTLFILALVFAADTGAFFAGHNFGRVRLAVRVSPNKTWEGVLGGMVLALAFATAGAIWFSLPMLAFLGTCALAVAFSVIGDLSESQFKRHVGLKDSGRLFPGHGGVLDRIDSVTAATPVMTLGLICLGVGA
jgi:phosphatidate cytidylyltransferase